MNLRADRSRDAYDAWKANQSDDYSRAIFRYAEAWADAMEAAMAGGEALEACAERTSHAADTEGITGNMYGMAVAILAEAWEHGEALRQWHNLTTQLAHEGEAANQKPGAVLNPARLRMTLPEEPTP